MNKPHCQIVIAGAGLAGLTSAAYLSRAGYSVLLIEKTGSCGGLLNSIKRDGYVFDTGARSIENAGVIRPFLKDLGIEIELMRSPVSLGIENQIIDIESRDSTREYRNLLEELYPEHKKEIKKIFSVIEKVMKEMHVIYGFDNPVFRDFKNDKEYLFKELLPWLGRFLLAVSRMNRLNEPIEQYLGRISSYKPLNDIIGQHFFKKTPMFFALGYFYVYLDYLYPKGGTGKLAEKLAEKLISTGGEILYDTEIQQIYAAEKCVTGTHNLNCSYDTLLWCADLKTLYKIADTTGLNSRIIHKIDTQKQRIMGSRGGDSVFTLYLGLDMPADKFAALTHGHLFYTPSREGLAETHRSELADLLSSEKQNNRDEILVWVRKYSHLTTYEISIPSLREPELSPAGRTGMIVSFLFEYDLVKKVLDQDWYEEFKTQVEDAMIGVLDSSVFPGIKDKISLRFSSSPSTIERLFSNSEGGITGWTFEKASPVISNLLKIPKSVKTPFPYVMQAGQWAYSPAGIPTAILTGWYAYDAIIKKRG
jgi:all-trans-retinol 13,14-reductase